MKLKELLFLSVFLTLTTTPFAIAGEGRGSDVGNGGGAWVCRRGQNPEGRVDAIELIDMWEAEHELGLTLRNDINSRELFVQLFMERVAAANPMMGAAIRPRLDEVLAAARAAVDAQIPYVQDALPAAQPLASWCPRGVVRPEQVALFRREGILVIRQDLFSLLSARSQAALYAHEAVYLTLREIAGDTDSRWSRLLVAHGFSDSSGNEHFLETVTRIDQHLKSALVARFQSGTYRDAYEGDRDSDSGYCVINVSSGPQRVFLDFTFEGTTSRHCPEVSHINLEASDCDYQRMTCSFPSWSRRSRTASIPVPEPDARAIQFGAYTYLLHP